MLQSHCDSAGSAISARNYRHFRIPRETLSREELGSEIRASHDAAESINLFFGILRRHVQRLGPLVRRSAIREGKRDLNPIPALQFTTFGIIKEQVASGIILQP